MIRTLTYQDIPPAVRAKRAAEAQRRLQGVLMDPTASADQREAARRQQVVLRQWSQGKLPSASPTELAAPESPQPPSSGPQEHRVEVEESLSVKEH